MVRKLRQSNVVKSKGEISVHGLTVKEWQRTPKTLLQEWAQGEKRGRPIYTKAPCRETARFRCRVIIKDDKGNAERDIVMVTQESYASEAEAEHATALLVLHKVDGERQHEKKLPEPYSSAWLALTGRGGEVAAAAAAKKAAAEADEPFGCEWCDKRFKKEHGLALHVKREHAEDIARAEAVAAQEAAELAELQAAMGAMGSGASSASASTGSGAAASRSAASDSASASAPSMWGDDSASVAASTKTSSTAQSSAAFSISAQGRFATKHERKLADSERHAARKQVERRHDQFKNSNPYSTVFMSDEHRAIAEGVVKAYSSSTGAGAGGREAPSAESSAVFARLHGLGFREQDVREAIARCGAGSSGAELLDWLCIYSPEEYLPKGFDPRGKQFEGVSLAGRKASVLQNVLGLLLETAAAPAAQPVHVRPPAETAGETLARMLPALQRFFRDHVVEAEGSEYDREWPARLRGAADAAWAEARADEAMALESLLQEGEIASAELAVGRHRYAHHSLKLGALPGVPGLSALEVLAVHDGAGELVEYPGRGAVVALFWNSDLNRHVNAHVTRELCRAALRAGETPQIYELFDAAKRLAAEAVTARPRFPFPASQVWAASGAAASAILDLDDVVAAAAGGAAGGSKGHHGGRGGPSNTQRQQQQRRDNSEQMRAEQARRSASDGPYKAMLAARARLPAAKQRAELVQTVRENQVVLVAGETGCGKTTQVPQFLLDDAIESGRGGVVNILCTQPRRLAAIGVAQRVADERCEEVGRGAVGYQIRLENKTCAATRLSFMTTGILLRRLSGDPSLAGVTHLLVDEVHERNVDADFLLSIVKSLLPRRPDLRVVLMSATMDAGVFCDYFGTRAVVSIPGFVHPVTDLFLEDVVARLGWPLRVSEADKAAKGEMLALARLEQQTDYELLAALVMHVHEAHREAAPEGSVLVFMSGAGEISRAISAIQRRDGAGALLLLPLHGALSGKDQARVFSRAPRGQRKVVVATNVAETSITIDDVVFVIDSGRLKETQYDPANRMSMLVETWVSRANARQRRGRAGRVRPGTCFKLYTRHRHDDKMAAAQLPEIHRVPLEQLVLQVLHSGLGQPEAFMRTLVEPPPGLAVREAERLLRDVGASAADPATGAALLTPLGQHLAQLPMDVRIGKMLVYGSLLGCAEQVLTIAALLSVRSPFVSPADKRAEAAEAKKELLGGEGGVEVTQSDHLCLMYAFDKWNELSGEGERRRFCDRFFLHHQSLSEALNIRKDLQRTLGEIGFNATSSAAKEGRALSRASVALVRAALCAGLYPNVINVLKPNTRFAETLGGAVALAPEAHQLRMMVRRSDVLAADAEAEAQALARWTKANKSAPAPAPAAAPAAPAATSTSAVADDWDEDDSQAKADADLRPPQTGQDESESDSDEETAAAATAAVQGSFLAGVAANAAARAEQDKLRARPGSTERVFLHPSSVNFHQRDYPVPWMVYREKVKTSKVFIRDCTVVPAYALLLFGGDVAVRHTEGLVTVDGWITFRAQARVGVLIKELRKLLDRLLVKKIADPSLDIAGTDVMAAIKHVLVGGGFTIGT